MNKQFELIGILEAVQGLTDYFDSEIMSFLESVDELNDETIAGNYSILDKRFNALIEVRALSESLVKILETKLLESYGIRIVPFPEKKGDYFDAFNRICQIPHPPSKDQ